MRIGRLALACALALASLAWPGAAPSRAAPPEERDRRYPVEVTAEPALGCESAPSGWVPVLVTIAYNDPYAWLSGAPEADAPPEKFVVRLVARRWRGVPRSADVREETLSPGTAKRFFLYAYASEDSDLHVVVTRERDGVRAAREVSFDKFHLSDPNYYGGWRYNNNNNAQNQQKQEFRVALLSGPKTTALNYLKSIDLPNRLDVLLAKIEDPARVPDRRIGWAPFDMVVLHDYPIASLTPAQQEALRSYVLGGGRLLVSPGPDLTWLTQPFFRDLLPPGRPSSSVRVLWEDQRVPSYSFVRLEGAPPPIAATGPPPERSLPTLEELLPPGFPRAALPQEMVWEIESGLQQAEWALESGTETGKAIEDVLDAAHRLAAAMAAQGPTGTALAVAPGLLPERTRPRAATATARNWVPRWPAGRGEVSLLPFDLSGGPLKGASDDLRARLWRGLFERYRARSARGNDPASWPVPTAASYDSQALRLLLPDFEVPVLAISALALLYVGVVGPLNFFVLRRLGREPLVVFTVPAIAVASIFATVVAGYVWQGARARTYEATITHTRSGERFGAGVRHLGVLSAGSAVVEVPMHPDEDGVAVPTQNDDAADRGFTILERRRRALSGVGLSRWEGALLRFDSVVDQAGGVTVEIEERGDAARDPAPDPAPGPPPSAPQRSVGQPTLQGSPPRVFVRNETDRALGRVILFWRPLALWYEGTAVPVGARVELKSTPAPSSRFVEGGYTRMRHTLKDRAWSFAGDSVQTRRTSWSLAAEVEPDAPRVFTAPGPEGGAAAGAWGDLPDPVERTGLLFLEPRDGA